MTPAAKEVLEEAKSVAKRLQVSYFYLDMGEYENISLSKTERLASGLLSLIQVLQAYNALTPAEQASIENKMPFMISA